MSSHQKNTSDTAITAKNNLGPQFSPKMASSSFSNIVFVIHVNDFPGIRLLDKQSVEQKHLEQPPLQQQSHTPDKQYKQLSSQLLTPCLI